LHPDIVHLVFADRVGHRLPIRREVQDSVRNPLVRIKSDAVAKVSKRAPGARPYIEDTDLRASAG
jgi:hypothetical protein